MKTLYDIFSLTQKASQEDIKKQYRKLVMEYHPDKGGDSTKFKELTEAYKILSDVKRRKQYDDEMFPVDFSSYKTDDLFDFSERDSILQAKRKQKKQWMKNSKKIIRKSVEISLSLLELYQGVKKTFNINVSKDGKKYKAKIDLDINNQSTMEVVKNYVLGDYVNLQITYTKKITSNKCDTNDRITYLLNSFGDFIVCYKADKEMANTVQIGCPIITSIKLPAYNARAIIVSSTEGGGLYIPTQLKKGNLVVVVMFEDNSEIEVLNLIKR